MAEYIPFPVGTVRGPYFTHHGGKSHCQYMVQGPGGWVPFSGDWTEEVKLEKRAKEYAAELDPVETPLGHS